MANNLRFDKILVMDLELTCWSDDVPPAGERPEIIEIGLAEVDLRAGTYTRSTSQLIRNTESTVSAYCTDLTSLTQARIDAEGLPLGEALNRLAKRWPLRTRPVYVWGDDVDALLADCRRKGARTDIFPDAHDLHAIFRTLAQAAGGARPGSGSGVSVETALAMLDLGFEGTPHRAEDDARNTGRILLDLARRCWTQT